MAVQATLALPENATLEQVAEFVRHDRFVMNALEPKFLEARKGYALVSMDVEDKHLNGHDVVMGGAVFSLADIAFAVASAIGQPPTVTATSTIEFLRSASVGPLTAECTMDKLGRRLCYADVQVRDQAGKTVAVVKITGCRVD